MLGCNTLDLDGPDHNRISDCRILQAAARTRLIKRCLSHIRQQIGSRLP
jgi:hypothetical protein